MIRGINKRVIEINDIGSEYFEKAFLIVRDNKATVPSLEREADRVMQAYFPKENRYSHKVGYLRKRSAAKKRRMIIAVGASVILIGIFIGLFLLGVKF